MNVTAIIERSPDGEYAIYTQETFEKFGLHGYGSTPEKAKNDFWSAYEEIKDMLKDEVPEIKVTFKYDVASFLMDFKDVLSLSGLQEVTGINRKQLQHYCSGLRHPSEATVRKIEQGVHALANRLREVEFA